MNSDPVEPSLVSSESKEDDQVMYDIDKPHHNDVLCGRGVSTNRHSGNESFRRLVGLNKELYVTSTKRQKMSISRSIVEAVRSMSPPGRFLEKNLVTNVWSDIGDRKSIEKTSQALRDGAATLRKQLSQDLSDPDFLSAVFDMDSSSNAATLKDKEKSTKDQTKIAKKGGHRRVKSNPDVISAVKQKALARKLKHTDLQRPASPRVPMKSLSGKQWPPTPMSPARSQPPTVTPMSPPHSQTRSQRPRRVSRIEYSECSQSAPYLDSTSPPPPPMPPPQHPQRFSTMPVMRSTSFESPHTHHFEELRPPPRMSWSHYSPGHYGPGYYPPMSPQSGYMPRNPMSPGGYPMSPGGYPISPGGYPMSPGLMPEYMHRPPMSPGMNRSWSPQSYTFGQYPASPQSSPSPGWRSPISANHRRYGHGELAVPALVRRESSFSKPIPSRESSISTHMPRSMPMPSREESMSMPTPPIQKRSSAMCMSPMQMAPHSRSHQYHSCPSSPADFLPPSQKSLAAALMDNALGTKRDRPTTMSTSELDKSKLSPQKLVFHSSQSGSSDSPTSTTIVVCGVMDESRSAKMLRPEVEVILTDDRFDPEMTLDYTTEEEDCELSNNVSSDSDAFSPLPFYHVGENEDSCMDMNDDLFQMPIAPCEGDCGYFQERD